MQIYHYHPDSGVFLCPSEADPSPMEPGKHLIPAHATELAPPTPGSGQQAVYRDGAWTLEEAPHDATPDTPEPAPEPEPPAITHDDLRAELSRVHDRYSNGTTEHRGIQIAIDVEARVNARGVLDAVRDGSQPLPFEWFSGADAIAVTSETEMQAIHDAIFQALRRGFYAKGRVLQSIPAIQDPASYNVETAFHARLREGGEA